VSSPLEKSDLSLINSFRCVMALIRGINGDCPCPICLVPRQKQSDYLGVWKRRTMNETSQLVKEAGKCSKAQAEALLKPQSLRPVEVYLILFYLFNFSNVILLRMHFGMFNFQILM